MVGPGRKGELGRGDNWDFRNHCQISRGQLGRYVLSLTAMMSLIPSRGVSWVAGSMGKRENETVSIKRLIVTMPPVLVCEECWKKVSGDGYLCVDVEEAVKGQGKEVNWQIYHSSCDPKPSPIQFRIWARFGSLNDLFLELAKLSETKNGLDRQTGKD